ncbi:MAG: chemotaxis protein CheW [Desulfobacterales bacterium]|nr:chemotaxis protein CheW [Desulfobacterales bacterium]
MAQIPKTDNSSDRLKSNIDERQLVCFKLAEEEFGVDINTVREIVRVPEITYIPRAPQYVRGIANLRGNVLPVIDGRLRFSLPEAELTESKRALILEVGGSVTGIVVDDVTEVLRISKADEDLPPSVTQAGVDKSFLSGVVKLNNGKRLILTIKPDEVLNIDVSKRKETGQLSGGLKNKSEEASSLSSDINERQFVSFTVGEEEYAFDIGVVKEILRLLEVTSIPNAPHYIRGLITVRNVLLPILDLRTILGAPQIDAEDQRILVVEVGSLTVGLLVDRVNEVLRMPLSVIDDTPQIVSRGKELRSVARLDDGKRLILILDEKGLIDLQEVDALMGGKTSKKEAKQGVVTDDKKTSDIEEKQLVTFKLGDEEYGFQITQVQEINRLSDVTRVPKAPEFVAGVTNLRGQVVPLINLRKMFLMPEKNADDRTRIIIVELGGNRTGIIVDQVNEVLRLYASDIEETPNIVGAGGSFSSEVDTSEFISGICKVNKGNRMILLLDTNNLLSAYERKVIENLKSKNSGAFNRDVEDYELKDSNKKSSKKKSDQMVIEE